MGGSGNTYSRVDQSIFNGKQNVSSNESDEQAYSTSVNGILKDTLSDITQRNDKIDAHISEIEKKLKSEFDEFVGLRFGGSVSKHTYVDGLSDIDILMVIKDSDLTKQGPNAVKDHLYRILMNRFPNSSIEKGRLAITVKFADSEIQILPAIKRATGYKIADSSGSEWSDVIKPHKFKDKLTQVNSQTNKNLIPMIKIVKSIVSNMPDNIKPTGYHIETLAIESFENYTGSYTLKDMVTHFFKDAPKYISSPIPDSTNQSRYVDDYCGRIDSRIRSGMAKHFEAIHKTIQNADKVNSGKAWEEILD